MFNNDGDDEESLLNNKYKQNFIFMTVSEMFTSNGNINALKFKYDINESKVEKIDVKFDFPIGYNESFVGVYCSKNGTIHVFSKNRQVLLHNCMSIHHSVKLEDIFIYETYQDQNQ